MNYFQKNHSMSWFHSSARKEKKSPGWPEAWWCLLTVRNSLGFSEDVFTVHGSRPASSWWTVSCAVNYCRFFGVSELTHWPVSLLPNQPGHGAAEWMHVQQWNTHTPNTHMHSVLKLRLKTSSMEHMYSTYTSHVLTIICKQAPRELVLTVWQNLGTEIIRQLMRSCGCWEEIERCGFPDACWSGTTPPLFTCSDSGIILVCVFGFLCLSKWSKMSPFSVL